MAVAAIVAMRHHEEELRKLHESEAGNFIEGNDDIYAAVAKPKEEETRSTLYKAFSACCLKRKIVPLDAKGVPMKQEAEPEDYWVNPVHWPNAPAPIRWYINLAWKTDHIVNVDQTFNNVVTLVIVIAGINVGIQTYPGMDTNPVLLILDNVILAIFTLELAMKIVMEGVRPWKFLIGHEWAWNTFDTAIVLLSYPVWGLEGGSSIALLRLVRLARLGKLIKKIPALQMIMKGLAGGLSSITYILVLLFLVFYLYGVVGFYTFAVNDPFHFGTLPMSMLTLFRMATLENWGDIMFLNIFGCDTYPDMYVAPEDETSDNHIMWCRYPSENWAIGPAYFVSFIVVSAFVMLSLFIGAVTISMTESMLELKDMNAKAKALAAVQQNMKRMAAMVKRKAAMEKQKEKERKKMMRNLQRERDLANGLISRSESPTDDASLASAGRDSPDMIDAAASYQIKDRRGAATKLDPFNGSSKGPQYTTQHGDDEEDEEEHDLDPESVEGLKNLKKKSIFFKWWYQSKINALERIIAEAIEVKENIGKALRVAIGQDNMDDLDLTFEQIQQNKVDKRSVEAGSGGLYLRWAAFNKRIVTTGEFSGFMTFVIMVASINVGLQTDWRIMRHEEWYNGLELLDTVILYIFTLEIVMKLWAEGMAPLKFFDDSWNNFDFLIVAGSYVPGAGSSVTMLRLLRLLRVLKLVKRLPQLAVIINALLNGMVSIAWVGLVLVLFFYVFSILAMLLFAQNDPWHFGSLHMSFFSLFQAATLDDWTILMYVSIYGCDKFAGIFEDFPEQCTDPKASGLVAVFFFLIFILVGAQVLLSLFIGVISTSMDEAQEAQGAEQGLEKKIRLTARKLLLDDRRVEAMQYVFHQLDLDNGGTIEEEELKIGMDAIEAGMSEDDVIRILQKVAPDGGGVDPNGFILFLYETPMFSRTSALSKISNAFGSAQKRNVLIIKRGWLSQWFVDIFYWWGRKNRIKHEEMEAALTIQDAWFHRVRAKRASEETKAYMEKNTVDEAARRREIQASLSAKKPIF